MTIQQTNNEIRRIGSRLGTLKGLPEVENQTQPVPAAVVDFYNTNIAGGTGPFGTYEIVDFFGSVAGIPYNESLTTVTSLIQQQSTVLATLSSIYSRMANVVNSVYGTPPTITVPAGPGAGVYATYDLALVALINAANTEIGNIVTALGNDTVIALNTAWVGMTQSLSKELPNRNKASIDYANMQSNYQLAISAFVPSIGSLGTQTQVGGPAQFFEAIANTSNQYGQAFVGAMREGRNTQGLGDINVGIDNGIPSQLPVVPPQATLSSSSYTVAEARAKVQNTI